MLSNRQNKTIRVSAIFGYMAEKLACSALSTVTWAYGVVVTFWMHKGIHVQDPTGWFASKTISCHL
jgi:hypothetical protein